MLKINFTNKMNIMVDLHLVKVNYKCLLDYKIVVLIKVYNFTTVIIYLIILLLIISSLLTTTIVSHYYQLLYHKISPQKYQHHEPIPSEIDTHNHQCKSSPPSIVI